MTPRPAPILVLESDPGRGETLARQLAADGYRVDAARSAEHARLLSGQCPPRLVVLGELGGPRGALELLDEIRRGADRAAVCWERDLPAVVLGARAGELDALRAFEAGADDYLAQGCGYLELRARIGAVLRRVERAAAVADRIDVDALSIDRSLRTVTLDGAELDLRRLEFDLLVALAREPERVHDRAGLLRSVWGYRCAGATRTVDSHASRLRRKLDPCATGRWVVGVRGVGYRLCGSR